MKNIATVKVSAEATINCEWTVTLKDGTVLEYYSIDQGSPQSKVDDESLHDTNPELAQFIQNLWYNCGAEDDDEEPTVVLFDHTGKVIKRF